MNLLLILLVSPMLSSTSFLRCTCCFSRGGQVPFEAVRAELGYIVDWLAALPGLGAAR